MSKINDSKVGGQPSAESGSAPLRKANPESARRFDEIFSRDRHGGKRERDMGSEDPNSNLGDDAKNFASGDKFSKSEGPWNYPNPRTENKDNSTFAKGNGELPPYSDGSEFGSKGNSVPREGNENWPWNFNKPVAGNESNSTFVKGNGELLQYSDGSEFGSKGNSVPREGNENWPWNSNKPVAGNESNSTFAKGNGELPPYSDGSEFGSKGNSVPREESGNWPWNSNKPVTGNENNFASVEGNKPWSQNPKGPEFSNQGIWKPADSNAVTPQIPATPSAPQTPSVPNFASNSSFVQRGYDSTLDAMNRANANRINEEEQRELDRKRYRKVESSSSSGGDAILNNLRMSSEFHRAEAAKAEKQAGIIRTLSKEVADRILASTAALNAKQEVRISLKNEILQNTEVIVSKDGKMLSVDFYTSASESASLLAAKQAELRGHLLNALHDVNDVDVNVYKETSDTNDGNSQDGRSRNEYVGDYDADSARGKKK